MMRVPHLRTRAPASGLKEARAVSPTSISKVMKPEQNPLDTRAAPKLPLEGNNTRPHDAWERIPD
jgi:hypothetical protein